MNGLKNCHDCFKKNSISYADSTHNASSVGVNSNVFNTSQDGLCCSCFRQKPSMIQYDFEQTNHILNQF